MAGGQLLIVAPELDLRLSLEFLLEAEGYTVLSRPGIEPAFLGNHGPFACTILDHKAAVGPTNRIVEFCHATPPVILLSDKPIDWLAPHVAATVGKLFAARDLPGTISAAISGGTRNATM